MPHTQVSEGRSKADDEMEYVIPEDNSRTPGGETARQSWLEGMGSMGSWRDSFFGSSMGSLAGSLTNTPKAAGESRRGSVFSFSRRRSAGSAVSGVMGGDDTAGAARRRGSKAGNDGEGSVSKSRRRRRRKSIIVRSSIGPTKFDPMLLPQMEQERRDAERRRGEPPAAGFFFDSLGSSPVV